MEEDDDGEIDDPGHLPTEEEGTDHRALSNKSIEKDPASTDASSRTHDKKKQTATNEINQHDNFGNLRNPETSRNNNKPRGDDNDLAGGQQSGLGGEKRLNIDFASYGRVDPNDRQTYGKHGWCVPDGLSGSHTMYAQRWRFEVEHRKGAGGSTVVVWRVKSAADGSVVAEVCESPQQAQLRQVKGNTLCNVVLRQALDRRAEELERAAMEETNPVRVANLKSLVRELRPRQCTEGLLFFGLRHECVQLRALGGSLSVAAAAGGDDRVQGEDGGGSAGDGGVHPMMIFPSSDRRQRKQSDANSHPGPQEVGAANANHNNKEQEDVASGLAGTLPVGMKHQQLLLPSPRIESSASNSDNNNVLVPVFSIDTTDGSIPPPKTSH